MGHHTRAQEDRAREEEALRKSMRKPAQKMGFKEPAQVKVQVTTAGQSFQLLEHNFVNAYEVELDPEGKKIRLTLDLEQVDAFNVEDATKPGLPRNSRG